MSFIITWWVVFHSQPWLYVRGYIFTITTLKKYKYYIVYRKTKTVANECFRIWCMSRTFISNPKIAWKWLFWFTQKNYLIFQPFCGNEWACMTIRVSFHVYSINLCVIVESKFNRMSVSFPLFGNTSRQLFLLSLSVLLEVSISLNYFLSSFHCAKSRRI